MKKKTGSEKSLGCYYITVIIYIMLLLNTILAGGIFYFVLEDLNAKRICIFTFSFIFIIFLLPLISSFTGLFVGKLRNTKVNNKIKQKNPYIYYRELPNNFGIGVATLLEDSYIENEKDIIAVILDLCARKYLKLKGISGDYKIYVINNNISNLLSNEKYIMTNIINNKIKEINYKTWFNYSLEDGKKLNLFEETKKEDKKIKSNFTYNILQNSYEKILRIISIIPAIVISIINIKSNLNLDYSSLFNNSNLFNHLLVFVIIIFIFICSYIISLLFITLIFNVVVAPIEMIIFSLKSSKQAYDDSYRYMVNNNLVRTDNGIKELYKLDSFKDFLKDFGAFADKNPEEIVLWDRYLSYAQLFGLTKEILDTGYENLIKNTSFNIDNIDNISLDNIKF